MLEFCNKPKRLLTCGQKLSTNLFFAAMPMKTFTYWWQGEPREIFESLGCVTLERYRGIYKWSTYHCATARPGPGPIPFPTPIPNRYPHAPKHRSYRVKVCFVCEQWY